MPVLTKINTNVIADDAVTGDKFAGDAYLSNTATQNISGTYSENRLYTSDAYTLSGNATVNGHLTLSSIKPTADVVLTAGGAYTLTGTGVLSAGSLLAPSTTDLTGMTGELGSAVTGSPNLNLTTGLANSNTQFPAGHIIQTTPSASGTTDTNLTNGVWTDTVVTTSITPLYANSSILLFSNFIYYVNDNAGDSGVSFRIKKVHSGGTSYPTTMDTYKGTGSIYGAGYENLTTGDAGYWNTYTAQDPTVGVAGESVSYTLNVYSFNVANNSQIGGLNSRWWIFLQEVKR